MTSSIQGEPIELNKLFVDLAIVLQHHCESTVSLNIKQGTNELPVLFRET